jgi:diguanylate cyclase (GGDEF)-like protein
MSGRTPSPAFEETEEFDAGEATRKLTLPRAGPSRRILLPTLRVVAGPHMLRYVVLQPGTEVTVGRDDGCALRILDASVSRRHARIRISLDGSVDLNDLGSTNGTTLNGLPVGEGKLSIGDQVEFGAVPLRLEALTLDEIAHLESVLARMEAANRDVLTGLLTRAWMEEELPAMLERCMRAAAAIACIFLDVDHFKRINDTWGHAVGDDVLVGVARLVMLGVRDSDAVVRYGGEELLVVLPGARHSDALEIAERIRKGIAEHDWSRTAEGLHVTASLGVAERIGSERPRDWLARADRALYVAKSEGRNAVCPAEAPPTA